MSTGAHENLTSMLIKVSRAHTTLCKGVHCKHEHSEEVLQDIVVGIEML